MAKKQRTESRVTILDSDGNPMDLGYATSSMGEISVHVRNSHGLHMLYDGKRVRATQDGDREKIELRKTSWLMLRTAIGHLHDASDVAPGPGQREKISHAVEVLKPLMEVDENVNQ